jgi:DNA invertase Pin-like site-specific DNA recombinase
MTLEPTITVQKQAVAYLRVSTDEQTCLNQKLEIEQYAKLNGFTIKEFYQDEATSGKTDPAKRRGFGAMMQFVQGHHVDAIIVYSISRIGRDMMTTLETIRNIEKLAPVVPIASSEKLLQTLDPSFRAFMLAVFGFMADLERKMIIERVNAGIARAKAQGKVCGRPKKKIETELLVAMYKSGARIEAIKEAFSIANETIYRRLEEQGVIDRHNNRDRSRYRCLIVDRARYKTGQITGPTLILELLRELGHAHGCQIRELAKERYPNRPLHKSYVYCTLGRLRRHGKIARAKDDTYYVVEQESR